MISPPALMPQTDLQGSTPPALSILNGAEVTGIDFRPYDRLGFIHVTRRKASGKKIPYTIALEAMGGNANLAVVDDAGKIIYLHSDRNNDPDRPFGIGAIYHPPRCNKQFSLDNRPAVFRFEDLTGFYPLTVKHATEWSSRLGGDDLAAEYLKSALHDDPNFYFDADGKLLPFPPASGEPVPVPISQALQYYEKRESRIPASEGLRQKLTRHFEKQRGKYAKLLDELAADLQRAEQFPALQQEAELITANLHLLLHARGEVTLQRYTENGVEDVVYCIPAGVDMRLRSADLFKKAGRMSRSVPKVHERMEEVRHSILSVDDQLYSIETATDVTDLEEMAERFMGVKRGTKRKEQPSARFSEHQYQGALLYIGRSSAANHELVFRHARPQDLWFHAQGVPSAHVLLRVDGEPDEGHIEHAARLAASFSKRRSDTRVTVDYTEKKHVKKPKNTPQGFVIYHFFRSITVAPYSQEELSAFIQA